MKTKTTPFVLVGCAVIAMLTGCREKKPALPPQPDTEVQTSIDAMWATHVVTDFDMMCSYVGVGEQHGRVFKHITGSTTNTMQAVHDTDEERYSTVFTHATSQDGHRRHGEVRLIYDPDHALNDFTNPNAVYYQEFGFGGLLALTDFRVDSVMVNIVSPGFAYIVNKNTAPVNPETEKLRWDIWGKFIFRDPRDPSGNSDIYWDGRLTKVLENTGDPDVFKPGQNLGAIDWDKARISYYGEISGTFGGTRVAADQPNSGGTPFRISIPESRKLIRDFTCSPYRARGVNMDAENLTPDEQYYHPFVEGVATFSYDDKYPRQVAFGNEHNRQLQGQCDNTGEVMIKGIAYRVNFR